MADLPPIPAHMAHLPRHQIMGMSAPVPWFVQWLKDGEACRSGEGEPDFRIIDSAKLPLAIRQSLCWVCGGRLGRYKAFTIGPMCAVNRTTSEPPSHLACALFSAKACPFLTRPKMRRREKGLPEVRDMPAGLFLERNPGAICVWVTTGYRVFNAPGGLLIRIGEPTEVYWFAEGRTATREEVQASIDSGYPSLLAVARQEGPDAVSDLSKMMLNARRLLPQEKVTT